MQRNQQQYINKTDKKAPVSITKIARELRQTLDNRD
jgi:hypothetical protein